MISRDGWLGKIKAELLTPCNKLYSIEFNSPESPKYQLIEFLTMLRGFEVRSSIPVIILRKNKPTFPG